MKKLIIASIAINILLIFCTVDDFLALHDIKKDYVSKSVLSYLLVETSAPLPTWTDTRLEWTSVTISYALRSILIVSNLVILLLLTKRLPNGNCADGPETGWLDSRKEIE
jgi:predicted transglutaminase-like protease